MVGHDGHRGWVYYLAVDANRRGTGVGRQMTSAAENWLREHGAVKVPPMVRTSNQAVLGSYEHLGYDDATVRARSKRLIQMAPDEPILRKSGLDHMTKTPPTPTYDGARRDLI